MTQKDKKPVNKEISEPAIPAPTSPDIPDMEDDEDESGFCCGNPSHHKR